MVGLVAVCGVLCAHRARPRARLPYRRGAPPPRTARAQTWPRLRCINGGALLGVTHGRGAYRLAPSHQPHRLALLWHGTALWSGPLYRSVRRLCIVGRSEEHTSELQSHSDLVCRLMLEKKKKKTKKQQHYRKTRTINFTH